MPPQILHEIAGQLLDVQHVVLDGPGEGQTLAHLRVVELGPQDTRRVQQLQRAVHRHPLLAAGDAGPVLGFCGLAAGYLIDKGGFSHVGDAQHHDPHHTSHLPLLGIGLQLVPQQLPHGGGELGGAGAALGVGLQHGIALLPEVGSPAPGLAGIGLIHSVQHHQTGLARRQLVHIRVPAGQRDAGIQNFAHGVHMPDLGGDHPPGLGHVTGEPAQALYLYLSHTFLRWIVTF